MTNQEMDIFKIISAAGDSRGAAFEALRFARQGDFTAADNKMKEAKEKSIAAHDVQTKLITAEINGDKTETSLLMVHAQDHLMNSILARDLIEEMIEMLREK
ncbi:MULTISPECIES: PTS lactose/cellobiose transporter subunit IIA [Enterococcus]|uniref:PTS lactose/cellobiose transporter subunit IIA n=1 Tax=Enterococcus alishanensis TaxID=1303817 RepID=A0ABS6T9B3_9ENTE|nr:PTS lactose/cellobiose transporter subunit IIA [Enterococcus alishanensis]MBV7389489.1 PTS lactose/cellobiose transporter subunit IIA [Enterococcus alishanensis]